MKGMQYGCELIVKHGGRQKEADQPARPDVNSTRNKVDVGRLDEGKNLVTHFHRKLFAGLLGQND
jgi:hypothetical protein